MCDEQTWDSFAYSEGFQLRSTAGERALLCKYITTPGNPRTPMAIVITSMSGLAESPLVRINSPCFTSETLGDAGCDCGWQLQESLSLIEDSQNGAMIYILDQEGRGLGLARKIDILASAQSRKCSFSLAALGLGLPLDCRNYDVAIRILRDLNVTSARLLTNNPAKISALDSAGIAATRIPLLQPDLNAAQLIELDEKCRRLGHLVGSLL